MAMAGSLAPLHHGPFLGAPYIITDPTVERTTAQVHDKASSTRTTTKAGRNKLAPPYGLTTSRNAGPVGPTAAANGWTNGDSWPNEASGRMRTLSSHLKIM